ncbi:beta-N-acetylhexosaminidase [Acidipila sp. EB88]|uniref:beta-N-acetylhexosaminidase n=1 Tax=Acidipila sp. EB88 TaxID=2305226 RepID=UPI001315747B|nr:family 20 glycosylhydrolase [Acidipila sp. EB88]
MFPWKSCCRSLTAPVAATLLWMTLSPAAESQRVPAATLPFAPVLPQSVAPALMPLPASVERGTGTMRLDQNFKIVLEGYREARLDRAAARLQERIERATGIILLPQATGAQSTLTVRTTRASKPVQALDEDESYTLEVTSAGATLTAPNPLGVLRGMQTFLQLIHQDTQGFVLDAITVRDKPRFAWRGLMLDSSRHFQPMPQVLQQLDAMEMVKLNVFHWHLSDDQGFRVESHRYPKLQAQGSDGRFYTQEDIRKVVAYARDRGIRVIPEFDMPGHARSWFVGYPELAALPGPYNIVHHETVDDFEHPDPKQDGAMDPTKEQVYRFLDGFLGEMTALFPDQYFHIGGDECDGKQWDATPHVQDFMKAHGIKDDPALQAYFTGRLQKLVTRHHKIAIGWDEVLQPDTPKDVVIQSWRGQRSLFQAASRGNRSILSAGYYIDLNQPASQHYLVDPLVLPPFNPNDPTGKGVEVPTHLTPEQEASILGGEATEWTEYITPEILSNRVWPRTAAIAERLWSPQSNRDVADMYTRLGWVAHELRMQGIENGGLLQGMTERLAGTTGIDHLMVLAAMVQPPVDYTREVAGQAYDQLRPLTHLADSIPAESDTARHFAELAHAVATGTATAAQHVEARAWLTLWADNDAALAPMLDRTALTIELQEPSRNLARTAIIGLQALDRIEGHGKGNSENTAKQQQELETFDKLTPAALRNMAVAPVKELVAAKP